MRIGIVINSHLSDITIEAHREGMGPIVERRARIVKVLIMAQESLGDRIKLETLEHMSKRFAQGEGEMTVLAEIRQLEGLAA